MASAIARLNDFGQSPWYDNLARSLLQDGGLKQLIDADGIKGVTSNPTIFDKAMAAGEGYDEQLQQCAKEGLSIEDSYWELVVQDVANAADLLRPVYDGSGAADGFVSVEVSPELAHDTKSTISQAKELFGRLNRPNVMIKIPATLEGLPAIEANIGAGINTNVTLIFSLDRHAAVVEAYLKGLEATPRASRPSPRSSSVASTPRPTVACPTTARCAARPRSRTRSSRTACSRRSSPASVGRSWRRRARGSSDRCGRRRRRRTRRTRRRSTSTT